MSLNKNPTPNYDNDYFGWVNDQVQYLRNRQYEKIDMDNLIEEIESLGKSEKSRLRSHLKNLFVHLLKIKYQPSFHTRSWDISVKNSRMQFLDTLNENPSFKPILKEILLNTYKTARLEAALQTGLDEKTFPEECPWTIDEILKEERI